MAGMIIPAPKKVSSRPRVVLRFEIYAVAELSSRFSDLLFHALSRIAGAGSERFRG
jgi:hypothetical protein